MAFQFDVWGSDGGEYFAIMKGLAGSGHISVRYNGWGYAYPYFPGMYVLIGAFSALTGIEFTALMGIFIPTISGIGVAFMFLLGRTAFKDERVGLAAAAFLAVVMPHVFPMSHTMPGTLGDMLGMMTVLLFLLYIEDPRWIWALVPASLALVVTHHLTNFFVLMPIVFYVFIRELIAKESDWARLKRDVAYIVFLTVATFSFWLGYAGPFRDRVMDDLIGGVSGPMAVLMGLGGIAVILPVIIYSRRMWLRGITYKPSYPGLDRTLNLFTAMALITLAVVIITEATTVPGSNIDVGPGMYIYLLPFLIMAPFTIVGIGPIEYARHGIFVMAWSGLIMLTLAFGWVTANTVLIPYRTMQYLFVPISLQFGFGLLYIWNMTAMDVSKLKAIGAAAAVALVIVSAGYLSIPPADIMGGFQEGTTHQEMEAVLWCGGETPSRAMVASDHRMSSMVFGYGDRNATWEYGGVILEGDMGTAKGNLSGIKTPTGKKPVDYVLLTEEIKGGVALEQWENARPMSSEALAKFSEPPFTKVYDNGDAEIYHAGPA
jgi:hypothetical protein